MSMMLRKDVERMPDTPGKSRLLAALGLADAAHKQQEVARVAKLPDLPIYDKDEKHLQRSCEGWLANRGYRRMTSPESEACERAGGRCAGWFFHLYIGRSNSKAPLLPDLMIFSADMRCVLPIELKVKPVYQEGQREMINSTRWLEVGDFERFMDLVMAWEKAFTMTIYGHNSEVKEQS